MVSPSLCLTIDIIIVSRRGQSRCARALFPLFYPCFKIFGFYERARRVHKLYGIPCNVKRRRKRDAKKRSVRNIMSRRLFPPAQNTASKAHKLRDERKRRRSRRSRPLGCHIEYSWNKLSRSVLTYTRLYT